MMKLYTVSDLLDETIRLWQIRDFYDGSRNTLRRRVSDVCKENYEKSEKTKITESPGPNASLYYIPDINEFVFGHMFKYIRKHSSSPFQDFSVNTNLFKSKFRTTENIKSILEEPFTPDDAREQILNRKIESIFKIKKYEIMIDAIFKEMNLKLNDELLKNDIKQTEKTNEYKNGIYDWTAMDYLTFDRLADYENYYSRVNE